MPPPPDSNLTNTFTEIPTLDLTNTPKPLLLSTLRHALTSIGFLYISNHGVPEPVISDLVNVLPSLFALPDPVKDEVALCNSPHFLGYSRAGAEVTAGSVDFREQFEFANELPVVVGSWGDEKGLSSGVLGERLKGPNQWPSHPTANIKQIVQTYIAELINLGDRFLRLVAESLSLPEEIFFPFLSEQHRLKLVHYPPKSTTTTTTTTTQGVGPHKDSSGWWTFLLQASPPPIKGLQALNKQGTWIDIPPIPGTFVVNIGQAFEVVTNGLCKATTHRVLSGTAERFSVPFFQGVRGNLTKEEAVGALRGRFEPMIADAAAAADDGEDESDEGRRIDSPFLRGKCETWGEAQLRIKIRSHRDVGRRFYGGLYERYVN